MPPTSARVPTPSVRLRRLQAELGRLSVPALLRLRDAIEPVLDREHIRAADIETVLRAAAED